MSVHVFPPLISLSGSSSFFFLIFRSSGNSLGINPSSYVFAKTFSCHPKLSFSLWLSSEEFLNILKCTIIHFCMTILYFATVLNKILLGFLYNDCAVHEY